MTHPITPRKKAFHFSMKTINAAASRRNQGIYPRATAAYFVPQDLPACLSKLFLFKSDYTACERQRFGVGERKGALCFFPAVTCASMQKEPLSPETAAISVALMLAESLQLSPEQKGFVLVALSMFGACFEELEVIGDE